jgi:hypothetical protein
MPRYANPNHLEYKDFWRAGRRGSMLEEGADEEILR